MRIVIDLDGTICEIKDPTGSYENVKPLPGAVEKIAEMRAQGHYIIIQTARNMATCESNLGKVMKNIGLVTLEWLQKHAIEYDEIYFGKPNAHIYIDDRALRHESWDQITPDILQKAAGER
jgi:capsule biosynthesis phosphatase